VLEHVLRSRLRAARWRRRAVAAGTLAALAFGAAMPPTALAVPRPATQTAATTVVTIGANGAFWATQQLSQTQWSPAVQVSPAGLAPAGAPVSVLRWPDGSLDVQTVGHNGAVLDLRWQDGGWLAIRPVSPPQLAPPGGELTVTGSGSRAYLYLIGTTGRMLVLQLDPNLPLPPEDPLPISAVGLFSPGAPLGASTAPDGSTLVASITTSRAVIAIRCPVPSPMFCGSPGAWRQYEVPGTRPAGGILGSTPVVGGGVATTSSGTDANVVYVGGDGTPRVAPLPPSGVLSNPRPIPSPPAPPAAGLSAATLNGQVAIAYAGTDGAVHALRRTGTSWGSVRLTATGVVAPGSHIGTIWNGGGYQVVIIVVVIIIWWWPLPVPPPDPIGPVAVPGQFIEAGGVAMF